MNTLSLKVAAAQRRTVFEWVATITAMEEALARALREQRGIVADCKAARDLVERACATAEQQAEKLRGHVTEIGGSPTLANDALVSRLGALIDGSMPGLADLPVTTILWHDYAACQHMFMGYGALFAVTHRAYPERMDEPTFRLAERHQRAYAELAQSIVGASADVWLWELSRTQNHCLCLCPTCNGLGACICTTGALRVSVDALAETAVPPEPGIPVRVLRPDGPAARAGVRAGDVIVAADGKEAPDGWALNTMLAAFRAGSTVCLGVQRADLSEGAVEEVTVVP